MKTTIDSKYLTMNEVEDIVFTQTKGHDEVLIEELHSCFEKYMTVTQLKSSIKRNIKHREILIKDAKRVLKYLDKRK